MKVLDALARAFLDEGVTTLFSLMGDANMYWMASLFAQGEVRNVHVRHENAAIAMADGYARTTGRVGVATVTSGPGLTQVGTALIGAVRYRSPMVIFAGDVAAGDETALQYVDQRAFAATCGATYVSVTTASTCLDRVRDAFTIARERSTPVVLAVPMDVQEEMLPFEYEYGPRPLLRGKTIPDADALDAAAGMIASSTRPIIIVGSGAVQGDAVAAIHRLGDRIGALYATTLLAKGVMDDQPHALGIAGTFATPIAEEQFRKADLVIGVGASLNRFTTQDGHLYPGARTLQIVDRPPVDVLAATPATLHLQGDAASTVLALEAVLASGDHTHGGFRTATHFPDGVPTTVHSWPEAREDDESRMDPRTLVEVLERSLDPGTLVVSGAGHFWSFTNNGLSGRDGRRFLFALGFGAIGQALPTAIGAAIGFPESPVVVIDGDSSILMHLVELDTAVRAGVNLLVVVMDDDAMGSELHKLVLRGVDTAAAIIPTPDLEQIAAGLGATGVVAHTADHVASAIKAHERTGVTLIDAKITDRVVDVAAVMGNAPSHS